jgi:NADP-dependent 3-hydroxy acid dehydrogenase YdfG
VGKIDRYSIHKHALDAATDQLNLLRDMRPRVTTLKPGYVDTASVKHVTNNPKLKPEAVAEAVMWVLNQPRMVHISSISMAHMQFG